MSASRLLLITGLVVLTMVGSAAKALGFIHMYIDAGHGGTDVGAEPGVGCNEKALNLKVAEALSVLLASEPGYATNHTHTLSRNSDVMVSLADRATEANDLSADMFLSIHHNGIWSAHTQFAMWQIIRSNNSQIAHWEGNKTLAQCIAAGVCASFASPAELTCKGGCLAGSEGCGDEDFYYVLGATNMPATISEAGPTGHEDVDEICSTSDPAWRDREASGHLYGIRCYFGDLAGSAIFSDYGAFGDTVYCETYNEIGTDSLSLWGFGSSGAYPDNGDLLHTSPGVGALSSLTRYEAGACHRMTSTSGGNTVPQRPR